MALRGCGLIQQHSSFQIRSLRQPRDQCIATLSSHLPCSLPLHTLHTASLLEELLLVALDQLPPRRFEHGCVDLLRSWWLL